MERKVGWAIEPEIRWVRWMQGKYITEATPLHDDKPCKEAKLYEISIKEVKSDGRKPECVIEEGRIR